MRSANGLTSLRSNWNYIRCRPNHLYTFPLSIFTLKPPNLKFLSLFEHIGYFRTHRNIGKMMSKFFIFAVVVVPSVFALQLQPALQLPAERQFGKAIVLAYVVERLSWMLERSIKSISLGALECSIPIHKFSVCILVACVIGYIQSVYWPKIIGTWKHWKRREMNRVLQLWKQMQKVYKVSCIEIRLL